MGCCFVINALVMDLPIVKGYLLNSSVVVKAENEGVYPGNLKNLLEGLFCAGAVIIPFGAVLCKVSPCQPLVPVVVKTSAAWTNVRLVAVEVGEALKRHSHPQLRQLTCCEPVSGVVLRQIAKDYASHSHIEHSMGKFRPSLLSAAPVCLRGSV